MSEHSIAAPSGAIAQPNLTGAAIGALVAALVGAAIWGGITVASGYEVGWIAWGVGLACGFGAVMGAGQGSMEGGLIAAVFAGLGVAGGKLFAVHSLGGQYLIEAGAFDATFTWGMAISALPETLAAMDLLFFGLALYTAFQVGSGARSD